MPNRPDILIEEWLPFETIGAESMRERGASSALPPLYFLHVWWARRPLMISRAAIVASVLPSYEQVAQLAQFHAEFPTSKSYQEWLVRLLGIHGDPVSGRKLIQLAKDRGTRISNPYIHERGFKIDPTPEDLNLMKRLLHAVWGTDDLTVLDPFSGGGSIPFEARRYGFDTIANELNPVATVILRATLDYPAEFGPEFAKEIEKWGKRWYKRSKERLQPYFTPLPDGIKGATYLWARTVECPTTGKPVPLSPNWWLSKKKGKVAVRLLTDPSWDKPRFEIVRGDAIDFDPNEGTVSRGVGRSPWTGETIEGDYIKSEARAGRMGEMLYAVAYKRRGGFDFRAPTEEDLKRIRDAEKVVEQRQAVWEASGNIPEESFPTGNDMRPIRYGMPKWTDFFSKRQLLVMAIVSDSLDELVEEIGTKLGEEKAVAIKTYLSFALSKVINYNCYLVSWHTSRNVMRGVFDRHDFSFKWSFGEFDAAGNLLPWSISQIIDAYEGIAELLQPSTPTLGGESATRGDLGIIQGSAMDMEGIESGSVHAVVTDPPYYDNVMYAELSDFFYVWLKRTVGDLYPEWFSAPLTNKDDEAVANPARFANLRGSKKKLAAQDYERKMAQAFREMHRVLHPDGVLTVMFTHKQVEAWDTLASALIGAGFSIESSWPVHTESEHSLHQAKKNAAQSTILLACRKRPPADEPVWWEDIEHTVRRTAREKAQEFAEQGVSGVDLYISTFGPVLSVISQHWPVLTSEVDEKTDEPLPLRPETALDLAREEVVRLRKQGLLGGRDVRFDEITDWYLMAWDTFSAERFPGDEARKLAITLGLDLDELFTRRVIAKRGSDVILQQPKDRRVRGHVDPDARHFPVLLDGLHTAMLIYEEEGGGAAEQFLRNTNLLKDTSFKALVQALLFAIPRVRRVVKGADRFVRPEAATLDKLRDGFFPDLELPAEPSPEEQMEQLALDIRE